MECPLCLGQMWFTASPTRRFCGRWECSRGHYIDVLALPLDVPRDIEQPITITEVLETELRIGAQAREVA